MSVAALIADMIRAGVDAELIGRTAELLASREPVAIKDEQAERRRAHDRDRKARLRNSAEVFGIPPSLGSMVSPIPPSLTPNPSPPKKTPKGVQKAPPDCGAESLIEAGVTPDALSAWEAVRKAKRAGPVTPIVAAATIREAERAGITPCQAVTMAAERGWQAFRADWTTQDRRQTGPPSDRPLRGSAAIVEALKRMDKPHDPERSSASPAFQLPAS